MEVLQEANSEGEDDETSSETAIISINCLRESSKIMINVVQLSFNQLYQQRKSIVKLTERSFSCLSLSSKLHHTTSSAALHLIGQLSGENIKEVCQSSAQRISSSSNIIIGSSRV